MSTVTTAPVPDLHVRPAAPGSPASSPAPRFRWRPVPVAAPATEQATGTGAVLVIGATVALRDQVSERLTAHGYRTVGWDLDDEQAAALSDEELLAQATAAGAGLGTVDGIVDLGVGGTFSTADPGPWQAALRRTVAVLKTVYDDWAAETRADRLFYLAVTRLGGQMGYDGTGIAQPLGGIWAGLAKSLPQELPNCRVKVLDLGTDADTAGYVLTELSTWDLFEIGWRGQERVTLAADRQPHEAPRLRLGPDDTVLLSGGGRGLGFALARELATRFGCRVVVSGRHRLPEGDEDWARPGDEEFERQEKERYRSLPAGTTIRAARSQTATRRARRDAAANLDRAGGEGLRIEYLDGDITDPAFARRLVAAAGPGLRVVVHNAGVASPTRLRNKGVSSFLSTVGTKVNGFIALVEALGEHRLDYFCNVGSVSGRIGGMVGQIDYAAANEALTRLGFWAQARGVPVATMCWPTWQQLGLIANYDAALRYAAALSSAEGIAHWVREIEAGRPGEVMYLGGIGRAVSPGQLKGFAKFHGHPDTRRLQSLQHYLGELQDYAPFRSLRTRTVLTAGTHPGLGEVRVGGAPALPVGLALEYALSTGDWVIPAGWPDLWLHELRDVEIRLSGLAFAAGRLELTKTGTGREGPAGWEVQVQLLDPAGSVVLSALACYQDRPPPPLPPGLGRPPATPGPATPDRPAGSVLTWSGLLYRPVSWQHRADGTRSGLVEPVTAADEWTVPAPPSARLPHAAIENALMAAASTTLRPDRLRIASLRFGPAPDPQGPPSDPDDEPNRVTGSADLTDWRFGPGPGTGPIALNGLALDSGPAPDHTPE